MPDIDRFLQRHERRLLLLLGLAAAARILFFSAALPFFSNLDEKAHFDTVRKYARGYLPGRDDDRYDRDSAIFIVLYNSPEYYHSPAEFPGGRIPPPLWLQPTESVRQLTQRPLARWEAQMNHEALSPPVYYAVAGQWFNLGRWMGLSGGDLLYWIRFLNLPVYLGIFWLACRFCRAFFPGDVSLCVGVAALIAFLPQDVFYCINSDGAGALLAGLSLYLLLGIRFHGGGYPLHLAAGLLTAAAFLTKLTNLAVPLVMLFLVILGFVRPRDARDGRSEKLKLAALAMAALLPIAAWMAWNGHFTGDLLAARKKAEFAGLALAPAGRWLQSPIFTADGLLTFFREFPATFWRGAIVWHDRSLACRGMDLLYALSSAILVGAAAWRFARHPASDGLFARFAIGACAGIVLLYVLELVGLCMRLEYVDPVLAARHPPVISDGRFALGALIPFAVLYVKGLETVAVPFRRFVHPLAWLFLLIAAMTASEIALIRPVCASPWNWFHL